MKGPFKQGSFCIRRRWRTNCRDAQNFNNLPTINVRTIEQQLPVPMPVGRADDIADLLHGQRQIGKFAAQPTQEQAASMLNVSERGVRNATVVLDHGTAKLQDRVAKSEPARGTAADVASRIPIPQKKLQNSETAAIDICNRRYKSNTQPAGRTGPNSKYESCFISM